MIEVPKIYLRAQITIEFEADDFVDAASHQAKLAQAVADLRRDYADMQFSIRERRFRGGKEIKLRPVFASTGNLKRSR